jgi:intracellular sulfur oxidation DsrE/DsrF family protein
MKTIVSLISISMIGLIFCGTVAAAADSSSQNPAITGAGSINPTPHAAYKPNPASTYKIVFALANGAPSPDKISPSLQQLARAVNLYASAGVPSNHTKFVGVVTLQGTAMLLDNKTYQHAWDMDNPNLKIIKQLKARGVKFLVDEQTLANLRKKYSFLKDSDFDKSVSRIQSAITTIIELQKKGYKLMMLPVFTQNQNPSFWEQAMHPGA